jgi:cation transport regulator ChaC
MAGRDARYFAYGSNLASRVIEAWAPAARYLGPARLDGFRLAFLRRSARWRAGAADVIPAHGHAVWGALYAVSPTELEALDRKEFVAGSGYRRRDVEVELDGARVAAAAYEVVDKARDELTPRLDYLALMLEGARERGLPEAWIAELEGLPARFGLHA